MMDSVKVFFFILLTSVNVNFVTGAHAAFCFSVAGHSPGSHNFCDRCENETRSGLGVFWTGDIGLIYNFIGLGGNYIKNDSVSIEVKTITVDGVELEGWFHIILVMPTSNDVYAFMMQVEDATTLRPAGELTTDLLDACEDGVLTNVPTAAQLLPCHGIPKGAVILPNALAYSREANFKDGIIRSEIPPKEFHVNWRIPPSYACSSSRKFYVRVSLVSLPSGKHLKTYESQCPTTRPCTIPKDHYHNKVEINVPSLTKRGHFAYPHPIPPFYNRTNVKCHNPLKLLPSVAAAAGENKSFQTVPTKPFANQTWPAPTTSCTQGHGYVLRSEGKFNASLKHQPLRNLYLGRCTERAHAQAGAEYTLPCVAIGDADDRGFVSGLPTVTKYIEDVRYDLCKCELVGLKPGLTGDGGSLTLTRGADIAPPPLPPDYPDTSVIVSGSVITLGASDNTSDSNSKSIVETPLQKIRRKVNRSRFLHALLSTFVFVFLIPVSNFSARYMKETFYKDRRIVDTWFRLHLAGIGGTFVCFVCGQFVLVGGNYWAELLGPNDSEKNKFHKVFGWFTIAFYAFLVVIGGLRPYGQRSNFLLSFTIHLHALLGFTFYCLGLSVIIHYLDRDFHATVTIFAWILIDAGFHLLMTCIEIRISKHLNLDRKWFPAMELLFDHRNGPGNSSRVRMFKLYITSSLLMTILLMYFSGRAVYFEAAKINATLNLHSSSRAIITYY